MNINEFCDAVVSSVRESLEKDVTLTVSKVTKNNGCEYNALLIRRPGENVTPTLYLDNFYENLVNGASFDATISQILSFYEQHRIRRNIDVDCFSDYDAIKDKLVYKLINHERNEKLLTEIPHEDFLDLAIVFYLMVDYPEFCGAGSILIKNEYLDLWKISAEELASVTKKNTPSLLPASTINISSLLLENLPEGEDFPFGEDEIVPFDVLSNNSRFNGACAILYEDVLKNYAEEKGDDIIIIPSSIHETLLLPASVSETLVNIDDMIREVNNTALDNVDILSDHAYIYERGTNVIRIF